MAQRGQSAEKLEGRKEGFFRPLRPSALSAPSAFKIGYGIIWIALNGCGVRQAGVNWPNDPGAHGHDDLDRLDGALSVVGWPRLPALHRSKDSDLRCRHGFTHFMRPLPGLASGRRHLEQPSTGMEVCG